MALIIAETMQIDGGTAALILAVFLLFCLVALSLLFFGYYLAPRAGRGSRTALAVWLPIVAIEGLVVIGAVSNAYWEVTTIAGVIVATQVGLFEMSRRRRS